MCRLSICCNPATISRNNAFHSARICMSTAAPAATAPTPAPPAAPAPTPSTSATPSTSSDTASSTVSPQSDRIHSTDIAFKPNSAGWGYSKGYASGFDNIFKKKNKDSPAKEVESFKLSQNMALNVEVSTLLQSFDSLSTQDKADVVSYILNKHPEFRQ